MKKITPFFWFNGRLEEAMNFYVSLFDNAEIINVNRYGEEGHLHGEVMTATFRLEDQELMGLNGGPDFSFTEAISLFVRCETQEEVDTLWAKLTADGGEESQCGWLKDKFGLSWQIIPNALMELLGDPDPEKSRHVMEAMLKMQKIDVALLQEAYAQVE